MVETFPIAWKTACQVDYFEFLLFNNEGGERYYSIRQSRGNQLNSGLI